MSDNSLRISFEYKAPDEPTLIVYKYFGGGMIFGTELTISIVKTYVGPEAINLYSALSGKSIETIKQEAQNGV